MTKELHKAIMKRSRLRNIFSYDRTETSWKEHKNQRNLCVNLLKKSKKNILQILMQTLFEIKESSGKMSKLFSQTKLKLKQLSN